MPDVTPRTASLLRRRLERDQVGHRLPSVVAGLVREGDLVWADGAGEVDGAVPDVDTQYRIGSITKTFVAVLVLRLRDEGRLSLEDRVDQHVDDAPVGHATIAQLLSHASGLQAETDGPWWERAPGGPWPELAASLGPASARHAPGRRFHYTNVGYGVLGELVARHRGAPWDEVVRTELLAPLGMSRTTTRPEAPAARGYAVHPWADVVLHEPEHDAGAMAPAGQLWSTVTDLARWASLLAGHHPELLAADSLAEAARPLVVDDRPGLPWTAAHGLGVQVWNRGGRRLLGHGGSMPGFLAALEVDRETGDGVLLAANATRGLDPALGGDLHAILDAEEPRPATPWRPTDVGDALDLAGVWYWGPTPIAVTVRGGGELELGGVTGPVRSSRFRPVGDGTWVGLDAYYAGETLRVVRDEAGTPRWLDLASFVLTRSPYDPTAGVPGGVDDRGWGDAERGHDEPG